MDFFFKKERSILSRMNLIKIQILQIDVLIDNPYFDFSLGIDVTSKRANQCRVANIMCYDYGRIEALKVKDQNWIIKDRFGGLYVQWC